MKKAASAFFAYGNLSCGHYAHDSLDEKSECDQVPERSARRGAVPGTACVALSEPMYQYHLCRTGHFFMVCHQENESVGFVKLLPTAMEGAYEIVYVIGEDALWGHGLGQQAVRSALSKAFLHLRAVPGCLRK